MEDKVNFDVRADRPMPRKMSMRASSYPFDALAIGESFVVDAGLDSSEDGRRTVENRLRSAAVRYGKKLNKKFSCRFIDGERQVGVWRTA